MACVLDALYMHEHNFSRCLDVQLCSGIPSYRFTFQSWNPFSIETARPNSTPKERCTACLNEEETFRLASKLCSLLKPAHQQSLLDKLMGNMQVGHLQSLRLATRLHSGCQSEDCYDFVSWLPEELVYRIFSFLPPECLMNISRVNRAWYRATHQPRLFKRFCSLKEWSTPHPDLDKCSNDASMENRVPRNADSNLSRMEFFPDTEDISSFNSPTSINDSLAVPDFDWYRKFKWRYQLRKNWKEGKHRIRRFDGHTGAVHCLAYDAYRIVSGSADSTICVWKVCSNANWLAQTLRGHSGAVRCLSLLPLPTSMANLGSPTLLTDYDSNECRSPTVWEPPEALLISGSVDTTLKLWRLSSTFHWSRITCINTLQGHLDTVRCVQADQDKVVSGSYDCTLRLWDLSSSSQKIIFRGHTGGVVCLVYDDTLLFSGSLDNTVKIWNLETSICLHTLLRPGITPGVEFWTTPVTSLHLDHEQNRLFVAHHDGQICVWQLPPRYSHAENISEKTSIENLVNLVSSSVELVNCLNVDGDDSTSAVIRCIAGDDWHILCGCDDQTIKIWRIDTNALVGCLRGHEDGVTCLLLQGSVVISGSYDKSVLLYDFDVS